MSSPQYIWHATQCFYIITLYLTFFGEIMLCSVEKLLYFQGSRFSLGFLCHFSEWSHEACFSCVYWHYWGGVRVTEIVTLSRPREGEVELGDTDTESNQEGFFSLLIISLSKRRCGFLKRAEKWDLLLSYFNHYLFSNHCCFFPPSVTQEALFLFVF